MWSRARRESPLLRAEVGAQKEITDDVNQLRLAVKLASDGPPTGLLVATKVDKCDIHAHEFNALGSRHRLLNT